ncbi:hypothetical protein [Alloscardovia macacae]|uniref:Uncharacterized protein n=1 Tax=Alloscardovia macacae TaxID=1160091 RepID=A0A261F1W9_9BIFI|nr:hypothetical protein [Alloscardovia macacae]OZG53098.1 hypothetical protein ALMA_1400 [Alloscardovia macacae]
MSDIIQRLVVMESDGSRSHRDAPVQLINPDGTPYTGGIRPVDYIEDKNLTMKTLRDALVSAGVMKPPAK